MVWRRVPIGTKSFLWDPLTKTRASMATSQTRLHTDCHPDIQRGKTCSHKASLHGDAKEWKLALVVNNYLVVENAIRHSTQGRSQGCSGGECILIEWCTLLCPRFRVQCLIYDFFTGMGYSHDILGPTDLILYFYTCPPTICYCRQGDHLAMMAHLGVWGQWLRQSPWGADKTCWLGCWGLVSARVLEYLSGGAEHPPDPPGLADGFITLLGEKFVCRVPGYILRSRSGC